jgi:hypothetical protein
LAEPERDGGRLHGLTYDCKQLLLEVAQIYLVLQCGGGAGNPLAGNALIIQVLAAICGVTIGLYSASILTTSGTVQTSSATLPGPGSGIDTLHALIVTSAARPQDAARRFRPFTRQRRHDTKPIGRRIA